MNKEISIELNLDVKEFEKQKNSAKKRFNEEWKNDEPDSTYLWDELYLDSYEDEVDGNTLKIDGGLKDDDGNHLGSIRLDIPLDFDKLIDIFQGYIKKLNKVKTVMETVKEE